MTTTQPKTGHQGELPADVAAQLISEIKARGSIAAGAAACGIEDSAARPAVFRAMQGGRLIRDEKITMPDGTVEHITEWSRPDGELALLWRDEMEIGPQRFSRA